MGILVGLFALICAVTVLCHPAPPPHLSAYHFHYRVQAASAASPRLRMTQVFAGPQHTYVMLPLSKGLVLRQAIRLSPHGPRNATIHHQGPYWRIDGLSPRWQFVSSMGTFTATGNPRSAPVSHKTIPHSSVAPSVVDVPNPLATPVPTSVGQGRGGRPRPHHPLSLLTLATYVVPFDAHHARIGRAARNEMRTLRPQIRQAAHITLQAWYRLRFRSRRHAMRRVAAVAARLIAWGVAPTRIQVTTSTGRHDWVDMTLTLLPRKNTR